MFFLEYYVHVRDKNPGGLIKVMTNISLLRQNNVPANLRINGSSPLAPNLLKDTSKQDSIHLSFKQKTEAPKKDRDEFFKQVHEDLNQEIKAYERHEKLTEYLNQVNTDEFTEEQKKILNKAKETLKETKHFCSNIADKKHLVADAKELPRNIFEKILIFSGNDRDKEVRRWVTENYTEYILDDKECDKFIEDRLNDPSSEVRQAAVSKIFLMSDKEKGASFLRD